MGSIEKLVEMAGKCDKPQRFKLGDRVRVLNTVIRDGQTPVYWAGAIGEIANFGCSPIMHIHSYKIKVYFTVGGCKTCDFKEEELDIRFAKKDLKPHD